MCGYQPEGFGLLHHREQTPTHQHKHTQEASVHERGEESTYTDKDREVQPLPQSTIRQTFPPLYMMNSIISIDQIILLLSSQVCVCVCVCVCLHMCNRLLSGRNVRFRTS